MRTISKIQGLSNGKEAQHFPGQFKPSEVFQTSDYQLHATEEDAIEHERNLLLLQNLDLESFGITDIKLFLKTLKRSRTTLVKFIEDFQKIHGLPSYDFDSCFRGLKAKFRENYGEEYNIYHFKKVNHFLINVETKVNYLFNHVAYIEEKTGNIYNPSDFRDGLTADAFFHDLLNGRKPSKDYKSYGTILQEDCGISNFIDGTHLEWKW